MKLVRKFSKGFTRTEIPIAVPLLSGDVESSKSLRVYDCRTGLKWYWRTIVELRWKVVTPRYALAAVIVIILSDARLDPLLFFFFI